MQTCPSANYYEYKAIAIGARSQAAKTYLERSLDSLPSSSVDDLITHSLRALSGSVQVRHKKITLSFSHPPQLDLSTSHSFVTWRLFPPRQLVKEYVHPLPTPPFVLLICQDGDLTNKNCAVAVVGEDMPFTVLEGDALESYLVSLHEDDAGDEDPAAAARDVDMAA